MFHCLPIMIPELMQLLSGFVRPEPGKQASFSFVFLLEFFGLYRSRCHERFAETIGACRGYPAWVRGSSGIQKR